LAINDLFCDFSKQMAQFGSGEEECTFVGVADFSLSSVGLFAEALGSASAGGSAGHLIGSMDLDSYTIQQ
jgi:hypothetical protein